MLEFAKKHELTRLDATEEGVRTWTDHVKSLAEGLLTVEFDSWMTGVNRNVPGRQKRTFMAYAGGAPKYREKCDQIAANGYDGFVLA